MPLSPWWLTAAAGHCSTTAELTLASAAATQARTASLACGTSGGVALLARAAGSPARSTSLCSTAVRAALTAERTTAEGESSPLICVERGRGRKASPRSLTSPSRRFFLRALTLPSLPLRRRGNEREEKSLSPLSLAAGAATQNVGGNRIEDPFLSLFFILIFLAVSSVRHPLPLEIVVL